MGSSYSKLPSIPVSTSFCRVERFYVPAGSERISFYNLFRGYKPKGVLFGMVAEDSDDPKYLEVFKVEKCSIHYCGKKYYQVSARWLDNETDNLRHVYVFDMNWPSPLVHDNCASPEDGFDLSVKFREKLRKGYYIYVYLEDFCKVA
jgi:hypothetical protein